MLQNPNVERVIKNYTEPLQKQISMMQIELEALKQQCNIGAVMPSACPNCKEPMNTECACLRNKCVRCLEPVGNITFTVCDDCWDKEPIHQH